MAKGSSETSTVEQVAGFVKNRITGEYDCLFITEIGSPELAKRRALEKARGYNEYGMPGKDYDLEDAIVQRRKAVTSYSVWEPVQGMK